MDYSDIVSPKRDSIYLRSRDNVSYCVERHIACLSYTIRTMVEHLTDSSGQFSDDSEIVLTNIDSWALQKVIDWCQAHKDEPERVGESGPMELNLSAWDKEFFRMRRQRWIELVRAANFLDVRGLLETLCMLMARDLEKNSIEDIRTLYNIKNDFTEDEEREVVEELQKLKLIK